LLGIATRYIGLIDNACVPPSDVDTGVADERGYSLEGKGGFQSMGPSVVI